MPSTSGGIVMGGPVMGGPVAGGPVADGPVAAAHGMAFALLAGVPA